MTNHTDPSIVMLATLIHERTGLLYLENRHDILAEKLRPLLAGSFDNFLDYYYFLKYDPGGENEWLRLQSALAVNESYFWREFDQIRSAVEDIVPKLQRERNGQPVRIWHAACATGEEPYSMVIALTEAGAFERGPIEIYATDFNKDALAAAHRGLYRQRSFRGLPPEIVSQYFTPTKDGHLQLDASIRQRVNFRYANLLDPTGIPGPRLYDMIYCRNVFIYFSDAAIRQVIAQFYNALQPSGYLFVAAAESLLRLTNSFHLVEIGSAFAYQKRGKGDSDTDGIVRGW